MIKGSEHSQIAMLGRLQAIMRALEDVSLPSGEAALLLADGRNLLRKAMLRQWEVTDKYVSHDDT